jgi:outer membrane protein
MKHTHLIALASAMVLSGAAYAQKAGSWSASVGVTQIAPDVTSGDLSAPAFVGTKADIKSNTQPTGAVNYMVTDNIAAHLPLGLGFKHDIVGAGAIAGVGKIGETKALPITAIAQYRFGGADAMFRPYLGAGLTYAKFYKARGTAALTALTNPGGTATTLSIQSKFAPTVQLGAVINLSDKWFLDANYTKTFLKTRTTLSTGQILDATLNPDGFTFGVGYKF